MQAFPFELAERLLDGAHPVKVFREYRGLGLRRPASYLFEVETGNKIGSLDFMRKISAALDVSLDLLAGGSAGAGAQ